MSDRTANMHRLENGLPGLEIPNGTTQTAEKYFLIKLRPSQAGLLDILSDRNCCIPARGQIGNFRIRWQCQID